jgi:O-antigen/teichoic acid export membrane protein
VTEGATGAVATHPHAHLLRGSASVVIAVAINGVGGFAFWWAAAVLEPSPAVGSAQRLFTLVMFVTYATSMGLPVVVARWCPDRSAQSAAIVRWSLLYSTVSSAIGTALIIPLAPDDVLDPLWGSGGAVGSCLLFALITGISFAVLVEVRLMALRRWRWVIGRAVAVALARLSLLWIGAEPAATWLFALVAGAPAVSGLVGAWVLHRAEPADRRWWRQSPAQYRGLLRYASVNYVGLLGSQGPTYVVPFLVSIEVDDRSYAPFYMAWAVATVVFAVPHVIGQALLTESVKPGARHDEQVRVAMAASVSSMSLVAVGSVVFGPLMGSMVGGEYHDTVDLLPWLVGPAVLWAVTATILARARVRGDGPAVVLLTGVFFLSSLGFVGLVAARDGVAGAARGWALANIVTVVVAVGAIVIERRAVVWPISVSPATARPVSVELVGEP